MSRAVVWLGAALALELGVVGLASCHDWGELSRNYDENAASASGTGGGGSGGTAGAGGVDAGPGNGCPAGRGPEMVRIQAGGADFCIDSTEVTAAHYAAFIQSPDAKPSLESCAWKNGEYTVPVALDPQHPVRSVDYCDAYAFCAWAGKRLCAGVGGSAVWAREQPLESEWLFACTHGGAQNYPYGMTAEPGRCAFKDGGLQTVDANPGCEGGFSGVFDMVGNVWEWIDSCVPGDAGPPSDGCYFQGGANGHEYESTSCFYLSAWRRDRTGTDLGVRCCATPEGG